jgi:SAM-dependent methyltransferase
MSVEQLAKNEKIWSEKVVLREIYHDYYKRIKSFLSAGGSTLEIGGGTGNLKEYASDVITSDIISSAWLDCVFDAQKIPFKEQSINNIVAVDVLHHIEFPRLFFKEAIRVLKSGGRIVLLDPAITPISYLFYRYLHKEPVEMNQDPLQYGMPNPGRKPFEANQAIPSLLFGKYLEAFQDQFPELKIVKKHFLSFVAYPLSGGFQPWCLIPKLLINPILKIEKVLEHTFGGIFGFRILIVLEKQ